MTRPRPSEVDDAPIRTRRIGANGTIRASDEERGHTMLRSLKDLDRYTVSASDCDVGTVVNFLLDDDRWTVRYLVVETGGFLNGRRVLISPVSFKQVDWMARRFRLTLTRDKVRNSPSVDVDKPVSRRHEQDYFSYYDYPSYWGYESVWGLGGVPRFLAEGRRTEPRVGHHDEESGDVHLRSASEVRGYHVQGSDDTIGHIEDFIVDDETWRVRYLVVDTMNWWFGKNVLVAPDWASRVSWDEKMVYVDMSREAIKNSPEWDATAPIHPEYDARLYDHYGRALPRVHGERPAAVPPPHRSSDPG